jgi:hypothetical protein
MINPRREGGWKHNEELGRKADVRCFIIHDWGSPYV